MGSAQILLKQATENSIQCAKDYRGREEDFLIGSLRSQIRTLCNELDKYKAIEIRLGWAHLETLINNHADDMNETENEVVGDLMALVKRSCGGPAAIQAALFEYEHNPGVLTGEMA